MKHKVFTPVLRILITGTLIIMALHLSDWILISFTAVCVICMIVALIFRNSNSCKTADEPTEEDTDTQDGTPEEPMPTDKEAETWYRMVGKTILTDAITNLNTRGYKQLTINENGDIIINGNVCDTVDSFPEQSLWNSLTELMKNDGLNAYVTDNEIAISW